MSFSKRKGGCHEIVTQEHRIGEWLHIAGRLGHGLLADDGWNARRGHATRYLGDVIVAGAASNLRQGAHLNIQYRRVLSCQIGYHPTPSR